jgi:hypothetical protein
MLMLNCFCPINIYSLYFCYIGYYRLHQQIRKHVVSILSLLVFSRCVLYKLWHLLSIVHSRLLKAAVTLHT